MSLNNTDVRESVDNYDSDDEGDYRKIPYMFISTAKVTMEQAKDVLRLENLRPTKEDVLSHFEYMTFLKEKLSIWARDKVRQWQFEEARRQGLEVTDWGGIQKIFASDGSREMMKKMYEIMCGTFEKYDLNNEITWSQKLENEALDHFLLRYRDEPERKHGYRRKPGGIEVIIKSQRNECNKLMNLKTKQKHGKKIRVTEFVTVDGRKKKKRKGIFYDDFIALWDGAVARATSNDEDDIEISMEEKMMNKKRRLEENEEGDYKRKYLELLERMKKLEEDSKVKKILDNSKVRTKRGTKKADTPAKEVTKAPIKKKKKVNAATKEKKKVKLPTHRLNRSEKTMDKQAKLHEDKCSMQQRRNENPFVGKSKIVIDEDATESDDEVITKILGQRERKGRVELHVLWSSGLKEWSRELYVKTDVPKLYQQYRERGQVLAEVLSSDDDDDDDSDSVEEFECNHSHICFSMLNFKTEENVNYWREGSRMHGSTCKGCKGDFLSDKLKPTRANPAYLCINQCRGCDVCFCNRCFMKGMMKTIGVHKGGRRVSKRNIVAV